jgi:peptidoglycan/LPS O-acetylase OafA/YrhL
MSSDTIREKLIGGTSPNERAPKFYSLELMRFICAFSIVWGHLGAPYAIVAYAGLNAFIILSVALSTRAATRQDFGSFMTRRIIRIFIPWLVWCGFYLFFRGLRDGWHTMFVLTDPAWLLIGPEIHLWFLPFILISAPFAYMAMHLPHGRIFGGILVVIALPLSCGVYYVERLELLDAPWTQWCFALPPLFYAVIRVSGRRWGPAFILLGTLIGMTWLGHPEPAWFLLLAAAVFEIFLRIDRIGAWAQPLGDSAFGIYLLHPFFVVVVARFMPPSGNNAFFAETVFLASWAGSYALLRMGQFVTAKVSPKRSARTV